MADPKIVVDAILAEGNAGQEKTVKVFPVTIRRYALLEKLSSPFIDGKVEFSVNSIVPSAFVMTRPTDQLKKYCTASADKIQSDAFDWAETLDLDDVPKMTKAIVDQFLDINKASPDAPAAAEKKSQEASE